MLGVYVMGYFMGNFMGIPFWGILWEIHLGKNGKSVLVGLC